MSEEKKNLDSSEQEYKEKIIDAFEKKEESKKSEGPVLPQEEKDKLLEQQKELKALPEEFDLKLIGDLDYLKEIFSSKYDKFHSLDFMLKSREALLKEGYLDSSTLNEYLFWATMSRRLQIVYQRVHARLARKKDVTEDEAENIPLLKEMRSISEQVASLQKILDAGLEKKKQVKEVTDLHAETMKEAEEFIKNHVGEFSFKCVCGKIVNSQGLPHFAIMTEKDDKNEIIYYTFSPELWYLVRKNLIPLSFMAFVLRTSPEGVLVTAEARKEYGSKVLLEDIEFLEKEEKKLKELKDEFDKRRD